MFKPEETVSSAFVRAASKSSFLSAMIPIPEPQHWAEEPLQISVLDLCFGLSNYYYHLIDRETEALVDFFLK